MNDRTTAPSHDEIARAAFARYEARGNAAGDDKDDWYEAERELRQRREQEAGPARETASAETREPEAAETSPTAEQPAVVEPAPQLNPARMLPADVEQARGRQRSTARRTRPAEKRSTPAPRPPRRRTPDS